MSNHRSLSDYHSVRQLAIRSLFEMFEQFSEGTVIVDREARIVWINQRYARRFGLESAEQAVGRPVEQVIPGSLMREVVSSGRPMLLDILDMAKDPLVVMRVPIHNDVGELIGGIGFALFDELRTLSPLLTRYQRMQAELASTRSLLQVRQAKYSFGHFIGTSPASLEVKRRGRRGAASEAPVLLLGETGTAKSCLPMPSTPPRCVRINLSSVSTPQRFPKPCWKPSSSAPRRGPLRAPTARVEPANCRLPKAARCSSTK